VKLATHRRANAAQFHLYEVSKMVKPIETASRIVIVRGQARRKWESLCNGYKFQFCKISKF
jgi:hypothetical protein